MFLTKQTYLKPVATINRDSTTAPAVEVSQKSDVLVDEYEYESNHQMGRSRKKKNKMNKYDTKRGELKSQ